MTDPVPVHGAGSAPGLSRTKWIEGVRAGQQPNADALRGHLLAVHDENTGFTESCAARCRDTKGRNSYEWLGDAVDPLRHRRVLDLACGSGPLLALLYKRHGASLDLMGLDMSRHELDLAAERLGGTDIALHEGLAQSMPHLADGSVDVALCHWALTLMDPLEPVLRELRRVLVPGGRFAAIVDGPMDAARGYRSVNDLIYAHVAAAVPNYGAIEFGDPRVRNCDALLAVAGDVFGDDNVSLEPNVMRLSGSPQDVAVEAAGFFYAAFVLDHDARCRMLQALAQHLSDEFGAADAVFEMPINRLVVERR